MDKSISDALDKEARLKNFKDNLFEDLITIEDTDEGQVIEVKEQPSQVSTTKATPLEITKDDLNKNLVALQGQTAEILDHLQDIVLSSLPDNRTISETSSIIGQMTNITKLLYEMNFKNKDEVDKDAAKELNSRYIKKIIDQIHGNQKDES